ncbi:Conserved_hypothetical protein [Hexamita inflata]|uniref:Uncharacterized protein n=1 Tax=Hexamita inflata TaxID=28002 RepID=A0AA86R4X3_9EUKA|nr:Conserved hypothetical protein [Hexamita inflata]
MSKNIKLNIDVDVNTLINQIISGFTPDSYNSQFKDNGNGRFISVQGNGKVIAAYFHKTKWHSATAITGLNHDRKAKSDAPPGEWATAYIKHDIFGGDQTFYNEW